MKRIFFCLIVLLAFFLPTGSYATGSKAVHHFHKDSKSSASFQDGMGQNCNNYFLEDLLEFPEDDSSDSEDENVSPEAPGSTATWLISISSFHYPHTRLSNSGFYFSLLLPLFILLGVFRL